MKENIRRIPFYETEGIVIHGKGMGKFVGMPTANIKIENYENIPQQGVYVSRIFLEGQTLYGVTHIGERPTVDESKKISFETHILNFNENIYGCRLQIQLFSKIRNPQKFEKLSMLFNQIRKDCVAAQKYWSIERASDYLSMDVETYQAKIKEQEIFLTIRQFDVLYLLYSNPDVIFTKKQIYEAIWHKPASNSNKIVENTIYQIRKQLKEFAPEHNYINTVRGKGYKYNYLI